MAEEERIELSQDVMPDGQRRYMHCNKCDYDDHICSGCGEPLSHNGMERTEDGWRKHGTRCVD